MRGAPRRPVGSTSLPDGALGVGVAKVLTSPLPATGLDQAGEARADLPQGHADDSDEEDPVELTAGADASRSSSSVNA